MTTTQQIHTLLSHLESHTEPTAGMLFAKPLQQAQLDYSAESMTRLAHLFDQIAKKNYPLNQLIAEPKAATFFVSTAAYIAQYIAKTTDEPIRWLSFTEAQTEISKKNRHYGTDFQLPKNFDSSIIADIGDGMYCQPLMAIRSHLQGEGSITDFIAEMQQSIFARAQIPLSQSAPMIAQQYLQKIRTTHLLDSTIGFYALLKAVTFDFSEQSLGQIDNVLAQIVSQFDVQSDDYVDMIAQPQYQSFCYLLGIYLGVTVTKLTDSSLTWADFSQAKMLFNQSDLPHSLEYSLVMVTPTRYYTPILVITNALFSLTDDYPFGAKAFLALFRKELQQEMVNDKQHSTLLNLVTFPYPLTTDNPLTSTLPSTWREAMQGAGQILANNLLQLFDGSPALTQVFDYDNDFLLIHTEDFGELSATSGQQSAQTLERLYQRLQKNPAQATTQIASYSAEIALPTYHSTGIVIEIRRHTAPQLSLQLILPYRPAHTAQGFAIFPMVQNRSSALSPPELTALVAQLYASAIDFKSPMHTGSFWDNYYLPDMGSTSLSPLQHQQDNRMVDSFDMALLPIEAPPEAQPHDDSLPHPMPLPDTVSIASASPNPVLDKAFDTTFLDTTLLDTTSLPNASPTSSTAQPIVNAPIKAKAEPLNIAPVNATTTYVPPSAPLSDDTSAMPASAPIQAPVTLTASLQEQLRQDQLRLKTELSSTDVGKERKLITIAITIGAIIAIIMFMAWLKK